MMGIGFTLWFDRSKVIGFPCVTTEILEMGLGVRGIY